MKSDYASPCDHRPLRLKGQRAADKIQSIRDDRLGGRPPAGAAATDGSSLAIGQHEAQSVALSREIEERRAGRDALEAHGSDHPTILALIASHLTHARACQGIGR